MVKMSSNLILSKLDQELLKSKESSNGCIPPKEPKMESSKLEAELETPSRYSLLDSDPSFFSDKEKSEVSREPQRQGQVEPANPQENDRVEVGNEASSQNHPHNAPTEPVTTLPSARSNASDSDVLLIPINGSSNSRGKSPDSSQETRRRSSEFSSSQEGSRRRRRQSGSDPPHDDGKKRKKKPLNNRLITSFFGK